MFYIMKYTNLKKIDLNHLQEDVSSSFFHMVCRCQVLFTLKGQGFNKITYFAVAKVSKTIVDFAILRFRDNFIYETDKKAVLNIFIYTYKRCNICNKVMDV